MEEKSDREEARVIVTAKAPVNIAVIKYWGKRDERLILPLNSSLSTTLSMADLCTTTTVMVSERWERDRLWLNGAEEDLQGNSRFQNCLQELRRRRRKNRGGEEEGEEGHFHIHSTNNFPTAAGLASSASGFACLTFALAQLLQVEGELTAVARMGSGSACRSLHGGFVLWSKGEKEDGSDSIATQVCDENHWPELQVLICVASAKKKAVSSTSGMQTSVQTSKLLHYRADQVVEERIKEMEDAIKQKDFQRFGKLTMQDSNQFHAVCLDTYPPIFYMNDTSKAIVHLVTAYNKYYKEIRAAYTFDAGPNAVIYLLQEHLPEFLSFLLHFFPSETTNGYLLSSSLSTEESAELGDEALLSSIGFEKAQFADSLQQIIHTKVGGGPFVVERAVRE
ncbi:Diphosphomevalonate decarboxylase [Balamuthia mandrillaris]